MNNTTILNTIQFEIEPLIESLIEYLQKNYELLKNLIKKEDSFEPYKKIKCSLTQLFETLENNELHEEADCLLLIEPYILYIAEMNCKREYFGHINCIYHLINLLKNLLKEKTLELSLKITLKEYNTKIEKYYESYDQFVDYFNTHIYIENNEFDNKIDEIDKILRDD